MDKGEIEKRVKRAADMLELGPLLDRKPKQLSGGQRQRVAMGRAIVREPQVFLMDEPLSNLDAKLRVQMRAEIAQVQRDLNVTTIYVTHDQTEAMTMGDRVALMKAGVLQQLGSPAAPLRPPRQHLRRRLHRLPADEHGRRPVEPHRHRRARCRSAAPTLRLPGLGRRGAPRAGVVRRSRGRRRDPQRGHGGRRARARRRSRRRLARPRSALTEALGSEIVVHFAVDAPRVVTEDTKALEEDAAHGDVPVAHAPTPSWRRSRPRSRVRPGDEVEIAIDRERLHFFDPETRVSRSPRAAIEAHRRRPCRGTTVASRTAPLPAPGVDAGRRDLPGQPAPVHARGHLPRGRAAPAADPGARRRHRVADAGPPDRRGATARDRLGSPYAVRDYFAVNPEFGDLDDLQALRRRRARASACTSSSTGSPTTPRGTTCSSRQHPEWYARDWKGDFRPTPWWDWDDIIDLDYDHAALREYMTEAMSYWVREADIDGYRCDVAGFVPLDFWEQRRAANSRRSSRSSCWPSGSPATCTPAAFDASYAWSWNAALHRDRPRQGRPRAAARSTTPGTTGPGRATPCG